MAMLRTLQKDPKELAQASLALSVIEASNNALLAAFADFKLFFDNYPNPYPYVYPLYHSGIFSLEECANNRDVAFFLQQILSDPKANCTEQSCAVNLLGKKLEDHGDFGLAKQMYAKLCDVKNWSAVGVFENFSGSGFNKDFGVLEHPEADHDFKNNINADVHWFDIPQPRLDRWWDLTGSFSISDAIIYTQTFINSEDDKEVLLMLGVSGSLKAWVNDYQVASVSEERNTNEDVYTYRVKLNKGYNRILLQLGSSELKMNNFLVRIADTNGYLQSDISSKSTMQLYTKAASYEVKQIPFSIEQYFEELVTKDPGNFINQLLLVAVYNRNEKQYEAHKVLAALRKMAPRSTLVSEKVAKTAQIEDNVVERTKELEFIKTNDPESFSGIVQLYHDASVKENWDLALSLLSKHDSLYGADIFSKTEFLNVLSKQKNFEKLGAEINLAYQKYPDEAKVVEMKYYMELSRTKDYRSALPVLTKFQEGNFNNDIFDLIIGAYLKIGAKKEAIDLLKKQILANPFLLKNYSQLIGIYYDVHMYNEALACLTTPLTMSPYNGAVYYWQGLIYAAMGNADNAIKSMKKAVYYSPTNYDAREKLRTLGNQKKLFDYFKQNDAVKLYHDAISNEKYAKEEAVILINDKREIVYPGNGAAEEQQEFLVYVNSQNAIQNYKEFNVPYNNSHKNS